MSRISAQMNSAVCMSESAKQFGPEDGVSAFVVAILRRQLCRGPQRERRFSVVFRPVLHWIPHYVKCTDYRSVCRYTGYGGCCDSHPLPLFYAPMSRKTLQFQALAFFRFLPRGWRGDPTDIALSCVCGSSMGLPRHSTNLSPHHSAFVGSVTPRCPSVSSSFA